MAKIVAEFDTVEKTLSVSMDGKNIENVKDLQVFTFGMNKDGDDPFNMSIVSREKRDDEDMVVTTVLTASEKQSVTAKANLREEMAAILDPNFKG